MDSWYPDAYEQMILTGKWQSGPQHVSTKVSNVCNLSCRSCGGWDSNSFAKEGQHYIEQYQTTYTNPTTKKISFSNKFVTRLPARHTDYSKFADIDANITKLEFYGGEPLLNLTHLDFLEHLVGTGKSKNITLFYSTNCTQKINSRHQRIWEKFKKIEFSFSIDHIEDKFEYLRWPGKWSDVEQNVQTMLKLKNTLADVSFVVSPCCTLLNVYYIDKTLAWANKTVGSAYINMVANPEYLSINIAPDAVKQEILNYISAKEVKGFLQVKSHNPLFWKQFIIWTKRQDLYRQQDFSRTFPEFYQIIKNEWDQVTDLSESNFYK
jgi:sulfatase maturation enzyme AslB (radical SAM superfamily)